MAIGAIKALNESGKRVPQDIAVVGFDDIITASYINPPLTTIHQDTGKSGELLVKNLVSLINGEKLKSSLVEPSLIIRQSCGASE
jgi:DNA-binding LacI/PurR family transcriptional regulator